jgi:hypothetical protein
MEINLVKVELKSLKEELKAKWDMACHNVHCYSNNWLMSVAKPGYEKEWQDAKDAARKVKEEIEIAGLGTIFVEV